MALLKRPENKVYKRSSVLTDNIMHYCPGCTHGVVHKVLAEEIEKLGIQEDVIGVSPVGCAVLAYNYIDIDWRRTAGRRQWEQRYRGCVRTRLCSRTRAMAT